MAWDWGGFFSGLAGDPGYFQRMRLANEEMTLRRLRQKYLEDQTKKQEQQANRPVGDFFQSKTQDFYEPGMGEIPDRMSTEATGQPDFTKPRTDIAIGDVPILESLMKVYGAGKTKEPTLHTLKPGERLVGSTGQTVADYPAETKPEKPTRTLRDLFQTMLTPVVDPEDRFYNEEAIDYGRPNPNLSLEDLKEATEAAKTFGTKANKPEYKGAAWGTFDPTTGQPVYTKPDVTKEPAPHLPTDLDKMAHTLYGKTYKDLGPKEKKAVEGKIATQKATPDKDQLTDADIDKRFADYNTSRAKAPTDVNRLMMIKGLKEMGIDVPVSLPELTKKQFKELLTTGKMPKEVKELDENTARSILEEAGGDKEKARTIAKDRGYTF